MVERGAIPPELPRDISMRLTWNDLTVSPYEVDFDALLADWRWLIDGSFTLPLSSPPSETCSFRATMGRSIGSTRWRVGWARSLSTLKHSRRSWSNPRTWMNGFCLNWLAT